VRDEPTKERIVSEAIRLFAERGYRGTTVGDIEAAAGLTRRAGGLYKHFRSKEEVLEAAIERHVREVGAFAQMLDMLPLGDLRAELTLIARYTIGELRAQRPLIKIVQKDGDQFPALMRLVRDQLIRTGHETANAVMTKIIDQSGVVVDQDPKALATVALSALVGREIEEMMFEHAPGGLTDDEFIEAWVDVWVNFMRGATVEAAAAVETAR
jgi:AcrR family transcriptional regulator